MLETELWHAFRITMETAVPSNSLMRQFEVSGPRGGLLPPTKSETRS